MNESRVGLSRHSVRHFGPGVWESVGMSLTCECGHSQANHVGGKCSAFLFTKDDPNRSVLCQCEQFKAKDEHLGQVNEEMDIAENED